MNDINETNSTESIIREKIKERPINKRQVTRRIIYTAGLAMVFGVVACLTILVLQPVLERMINGDNKVTELKEIELAVSEGDEIDYEIDAQVDVTPYDDMPSLETPIKNLDLGVSENAVSENSASQIINDYEFEIDDYHLLYRKMYALAQEVTKSLVTVTGAAKDQDIFNDDYLNTNRTTGLIIADDGRDVLILVDANKIPSENLSVTFADGSVASASMKGVDKETGLGIVSVQIIHIPYDSRDNYTVATLGSSTNVSLLGSPVIAIGNIYSTGKSICYGSISSMDSSIYVVDEGYKLLTTDIYGSSKADGVITNTRGQVIGIICQNYNSDDMKNIISAYGISSIRKLTEDLSNERSRAYVGLKLCDITNEAKSLLGLPNGVYVTKAAINSPAMNVGIVPGDIIVAFDSKNIYSVAEYTNCLREKSEGDVVTLTIKRLSGGEYKETSVEVKLGSMAE